MRGVQSLLVRAAAIVALLVVASAHIPSVRADTDLPPDVLPFQSPYVSPFGCYQDVQIFRSLKDGEFDFCRLKLRYRPGRAECLRIIISTCNLVAPGTRTLGPPGGLEGFAERIICPPGPPPPTCPSGYFG